MIIDSDVFLEINAETELNEVIDEINKHATVKNSDKLKLRRAIKKLQQNAKNREHASNFTETSQQTQNQSDFCQNKHKCDQGAGDVKARFVNKEAVVERKNNDKNNDNDNDKNINVTELNQSFDCDVCERNMGECNLYYCILCNQTVRSLDKRKYYCKKHILLYHQEHKKCEKHRDLVVQEMKDIDKIQTSSNDNNDNAIQKLTFDVAMIEASKKKSFETVQKSMVKYLNECSMKRYEKTRALAQASYIVPPMIVKLHTHNIHILYCKLNDINSGVMYKL